MSGTWNYNAIVDEFCSVRLDAALTRRAVQLNVTCTISSCYVTTIRDTILDANYDIGSDMSQFRNHFLPRLTQAFPDANEGSTVYGVLEAYLWDSSQSPCNVLYHFKGDLTRLDSQTLARRLSQILNTFWIVDYQIFNAAGGFAFSDQSSFAATSTEGHGPLGNSNVTTMSAQNFLRGSNAWFTLLCMSTLVMLFASITSAVLTFLRIAPDATNLLSALTLSGGKSVLRSGSYLDGDERIRLLKADEDIGQAMNGRDGEVGALKKGRLYR